MEKNNHCLVQNQLAPCTLKPTKTIITNHQDMKNNVNQETNNCKKKKMIVVVNQDKKKKDDEQLKLAALAITFNVRLRSADMPSAMQERALRHARALLDAAADRRRPNPTLLARSLKKEFDSVYGPAWHCIAGKSFGSFVTHSPGGFMYFSIDAFSFLLFKTEVHVVKEASTKLEDLLKIN